MTIRFITEEEFPCLAMAWNDLLSQSDNKSVFLTHEWMFSWWQTFKNQKRLFSIVVYDNHDRLIGIAPLYLERQVYFRFLPLRTIKFLGMNKVAPDYLGLIIKSGHKDVVVPNILEFLFQQRGAWDIMSLCDMADISFHEKYLSKPSTSEHNFDLHVDYSACPFIALPERFDDYLAGFSRKHRYNLSRMRRLLQEDFDYESGMVESAPEAEIVMHQLFDLHQQRAHHKQRKSTFDIEVRRFHVGLISQFFRKDILKLFYIKLNDKIESCLYAYIFNERFYFYQAGFNPAWERYSLGSVMIMEAIRASINLGCHEFDFLKGREPYKYAWAQNEHRTASVTLCSTKLNARFYFLLLKVRSRAGRLLCRLKQRSRHSKASSKATRQVALADSQSSDRLPRSTVSCKAMR